LGRDSSLVGVFSALFLTVLFPVLFFFLSFLVGIFCVFFCFLVCSFCLSPGLISVSSVCALKHKRALSLSLSFSLSQVHSTHSQQPSPETVKVMLEAKVPSAICAALASVDLHHPAVSKVSNSDASYCLSACLDTRCVWENFWVQLLVAQLQSLVPQLQMSENQKCEISQFL
jgi:hypothetical protein